MKEIIFVYNADADFWSAAKGAVTKALAPSRYECNLCAISHGTLGPRAEWAVFLNQLPLQKRFLHRDEFHAQYPDMRDTEPPAILMADGSGIPVVAIPASTINRLKSVPELEREIERSFGLETRQS